MHIKSKILMFFCITALICATTTPAFAADEQSTWDKFKDAGSSLWSDIKEATPGLIDKAGDVANTVKDNIPGAIDTAKDAASNAYQAAQEKAPEIAGQVKDGLTSAGEAVSDFRNVQEEQFWGWFTRQTGIPVSSNSSTTDGQDIAASGNAQEVTPDATQGDSVYPDQSDTPVDAPDPADTPAATAEPVQTIPTQGASEQNGDTQGPVQATTGQDGNSDACYYNPAGTDNTTTDQTNPTAGSDNPVSDLSGQSDRTLADGDLPTYPINSHSSNKPHKSTLFNFDIFPIMLVGLPVIVLLLLGISGVYTLYGKLRPEAREDYDDEDEWDDEYED